MGLLKEEKTHSWEELQAIKDQIKLNGIHYFINIYHKNGHDVPFYWGEEIETIMCGNDNGCKLLACNAELSKYHTQYERFSVEFAGYMLESTPNTPRDDSLGSFEGLNSSLYKRIMLQNKMINSIVNGSFTVCFACFPNVGIGLLNRCTKCKNCNDEENLNFSTDLSLSKSKTCSDILDQNATTINHVPIKCFCGKKDCNCLQTILERGNNILFDITKSKHFSDNLITPHRRFFSFVENIRNRRGKKIEGYVRIMKDTNTGFTDEIEPCGLLIDSMGQGMGCCCLQITLQAENLEKAKKLYDIFAILSPLMLRITRATPFSNGYLLNTETRWDMLSMSVDCRTDEERGKKYDLSGFESEEEALQDFGLEDTLIEECKIQQKNGLLQIEPSIIPKSRFSSVDLYLAPPCKKYNDIYYPIMEEYKGILLKNNVDEDLAEHIASIFVRDPMLSYHNTTLCEDFENIQSSNWRSVRFKLPTFSGGVDLTGWKIEFRPMEIQMTCFENAAFSNFSVLLGKAIEFYNLNLYIPISYVEKNFKSSNSFNRKVSEFKEKLKVDNVKFYYRKNMFDNNHPYIGYDNLNVIFNGSDKFIGLIHFVKKYIKERYGESKILGEQIEFISKKFNGTLISTSEYLRRLVINHPDYKNDSLIPDSITNFIVNEAKKILEENSYEYLINN